MASRSPTPRRHTSSRSASRAKNVVFFGGAGVSTASGIPDFPQRGRLTTRGSIRPDDALPRSVSTAEFYDFYRQKTHRPVLPNQAHLKLAELAAGKVTVVTQNIDGRGTRMPAAERSSCTAPCGICQRCGPPTARVGDGQEGVPVCPECGGHIKPDVVLYEGCWMPCWTARSRPSGCRRSSWAGPRSWCTRRGPCATSVATSWDRNMYPAAGRPRTWCSPATSRRPSTPRLPAMRQGVRLWLYNRLMDGGRRFISSRRAKPVA